MYPLERNKDAFIMEFKVFDAKKRTEFRADSRECIKADRREKL